MNHVNSFMVSVMRASSLGRTPTAGRNPRSTLFPYTTLFRSGQNLIRVATVRMKTGGLGVKANAVHIYHLIHVAVDRRITVCLVFQPCQILVLRKLERPLLAASFQ